MTSMKNNKLVVFLIAGGRCCSLLPLIAQQFGNGWVRIIDIALLYVMLALGLNIVVGFAGLLDLGYVAFYAVGAYMYALLASPAPDASTSRRSAAMFPGGLHTPIWLVIPLAPRCCRPASASLLGAPVLKLRGDYLAIVTLGFGEIIRIFLNNLEHAAQHHQRPQGITRSTRCSVLGVRLRQGRSISSASDLRRSRSTTTCSSRW